MINALLFWRNPIFRRYSRSRLRSTHLLISLLVILMVAGFIFFVARAAGESRFGLDSVDTARIPIIPLLIFQGIILFMLGTGQAAGGMTTEADEGVLDYQRLAPMSPLAKLTGYLFGLPIREWILFFAVSPLTLYSMIRGEIPGSVIAQVVSVFILAGLLYHLTGLLAGTVMKNRRWAFLGSMGLVFVLYLVLPQLARFGIVYFRYVTVLPVLQDAMPYFIDRTSGASLQTAQNFSPAARFLDLNFPQWIFTVVSQAVLIGALGMMIWRRWRRAESHLLGKLGALSLFAWLQLMLYGNAVPLIETAEIFPSFNIRQEFGVVANNEFFWEADPGEALFLVGIYGATTLIFIWILGFFITPDHEGLVRGWRRARKQDRKRLGFFSDPSTATPWMIAMVAIGAAGWIAFAREMLGSVHFPEYQLKAVHPLAFALVLASGALLLQVLQEWRGRRFAGLAILLGGILPLMLSVIAIVSSDELLSVAIWLGAICPLTWPFYASGVSFPADVAPMEIARVFPKAFWFWQVAAVVGSVGLIHRLVKYRHKVAD